MRGCMGSSSGQRLTLQLQEREEGGRRPPPERDCLLQAVVGLRRSRPRKFKTDPAAWRFRGDTDPGAGLSRQGGASWARPRTFGSRERHGDQGGGAQWRGSRWWRRHDEPERRDGDAVPSFRREGGRAAIGPGSEALARERRDASMGDGGDSRTPRRGVPARTIAPRARRAKAIVELATSVPGELLDVRARRQRRLSASDDWTTSRG